EHISPYEEAYGWYQQYPWYNVVLEEDDKIVAFLELFPMTETLYQAYRSGCFDDDGLSAEDIVDIFSAEPGQYNLCWLTIAVHPEYRGKGALHQLFAYQVEFYEQFRKKGIIFDRVITDNVTEEGINFSKKLGFSKVKDTIFGTVIYEMGYTQFKERVTG
ncbi:MAG: GNAT family N-acetyltransferase, partial [Anaerovoracaceae bacterium]